MLNMLGQTRRFVGVAAATVAVLAGSACGNDSQDAGAGSWVESPSAAPKTSAPARLKKITSACKLLPATVTVKVLGGSANTKLSAEEQPVEKIDAKRRYSCSYGRGGQEALSFIVQTNPDQADAATETIDAIANGSGTETTRVDNLGEDAVTYVTEGARVLAVAVPYEKELRLLVLTGPEIVPQSKIAELAKHVVTQI
jgi:hypothetical protein